MTPCLDLDERFLPGLAYAQVNLQRPSHHYNDSSAIAARYRHLSEGFCAHRKIQFFAGRFCAHEAIYRASKVNAEFTIDQDAEGRPVWPEGITGSITHTDHFAIAGIVDSKKVKSLGIDAEKILDDRAAIKLARLVASSDELEYLDKSGLPVGLAVTLIFSAKESLFKCLNPIVRQHFGFSEAKIVRAELSTMRFSIVSPLMAHRRLDGRDALEGYFGFGHDHVHTTIAIPVS